ncbi:hypothetical protein F2Q70_00042580 [Brassica cretica]|uniref:Uncharacterized protein n=1 Tax=Brassica cretica TaxID=69181 RepID=A0A8S9KHG3_BRACR|nr:hypothetical protein F2Q70_00042580 [Brassica cretica]
MHLTHVSFTQADCAILSFVPFSSSGCASPCPYPLGHETGATAGHEWRQCCVVMQVTSGDSDGVVEWRQCCVS